MAVAITVNLSDAQEVTANRMLADTNAARTQAGQAPFPNLTAYVRDILRAEVEAFQKRYDVVEGAGYGQLFIKATATEQQQIRAVLDKYRTPAP